MMRHDYIPVYFERIFIPVELKIPDEYLGNIWYRQYTLEIDSRCADKVNRIKTIGVESESHLFSHCSVRSESLTELQLCQVLRPDASIYFHDHLNS